jgi:hypothetical protein
MRRLVLVVSFLSVLAAALALVACGGSDAETTSDPGEIAFDLDTLEEGAEGVRATLSFEGRDRTTIRIDGLDVGEPAGGGPNPAWLRRGSCDEPEDVVAELGTLRGPATEATVPVGLPALLNGDYAIAVGLPGASTEEPVVACGEVPDEAPD